jgi:predicted TIM-barrel fold metal-dependent hydrolase
MSADSRRRSTTRRRRNPNRHPHTHTRAGFLGAAAAAATLTLPGARALAQGSARTPVIDIHHHFFPPELLTLMSAWQAKYKQPPLAPPIAGWTPEKTLASMDAAGVSTAILSVSSMRGVWFEAPPKRLPQLARICNDYAAGLVRDHPGRFGLFATLPLPDVDAALKEIAYAFDVLHADGIGIPTSFGDAWPGDARFAPVFAELNRRTAMVVFHPYAPNCCGLLQAPINESYLEYPYDTGRCALSLLFGGTLVRNRDVKFTLCHAGGPLPALSGRIAMLAANTREKLDVVAPDGVHAEIRRFYYDTANAAYPPSMGALLAEVPVSQILFGSDYPYVNDKQNRDALESLNLPAADLAAIERGNALRLMPQLAQSA